MTLLKTNQRFFDVHNEPQESLSPIEGYDDMPVLSLKLSVENLQRKISKAAQNASIATERSSSSGNELTQNESAAIYYYTMDWKPNDQSLCARLNLALRSKDRSEVFPYFFYLKLFLSALWKLKSVKKTIWRGVKADLSGQYPIGRTFVWWGFSSCLESFDHIQSDRFMSKTGTRTLFEIECVTGKAISAYSYHHDINEILLLSGIQLQVLNQTHSGDGLCIIHLKEIKSSSCSLQSSLTPSISNISKKQNENNESCMPNILEVQTKEMMKPTKSYENKVLKELINKERKDQSIRFPTQSLNYDDIEMIADELQSNKFWTIIYLWENYLNGKHMILLVRGLKLNSTVICLNLDHNLLSDDGASVLASVLKSNTSLRTIYLNENQISDNGAQELGDMLTVNKTLIHLELSSNSIGNSGVTAISNALKVNKFLRTIYLNGNKITGAGAQHVANMLKVNKTLIDLQLSSNPIGDDGIKTIALALENNSTLESLNIGATMITMDSMNDMAKMLKMNTMLKSLYVNNNNLGDDTLVTMLSGLMKNTTLTTLDLSLNNLTDRSMNELGYLLEQKYTALTNLIINHNPLGDGGITYLAAALMNNTTVIKLMIESVGIKVKGVRELAVMLCFNKELRYLSLNNNQMTANSMNLLADALQYNKTLQYLYLNNCNLKDDCAPLVVDIMKQSKTLISIELVKNHLTEEGKMTINEGTVLNKSCSIYLDFTFQRVH